MGSITQTPEESKTKQPSLSVEQNMEENNDDASTGGGKVHQEDIVIVGGGIGGLAFAGALHRVGLKAVVLEQSDRLRSEGTSITLWTNAMRVLEIFEISEQFRQASINLQAFEVYDDRARPLRNFKFVDCKGGPHEMRIIERKALMEALARQLPQGTIRLNSQVTSIKKSQTSPNVTDLELKDGSTYSAKVVVGFDGTSSVVGSWIGLEKPKAIGEIETRGMAVFPDGHEFGKVWRTYGRPGVRTSVAPMTSTTVFWFVAFAYDLSEDWQEMTAEEIRQEALDLTKDIETPLPHLCINNTPLENIAKNRLRHRLNTRPTDSQVVGNVTVAGDASHPTSPNLGQGGGMALEDGIILARKLHRALKPSLQQQESSQISSESERIHEALLDFHAERHARTYAITHQAFTVKRNWEKGPDLVPQGMQADNFLDHTLFDVGKLPTIAQ